MDKSQTAEAIERILSTLSIDSSDSDLKKARVEIRDIFQKYSGKDEDKTLSLAETIQEISVTNSKNSREMCIFVLRINSATDDFPELITGQNINAIISTFAEKVLPDICKRFDVQEKEQNHIKINKLYKTYHHCCEKLENLSQLPAKIDSICAQQQSIMKAINDSTLSSFLAPYDFTHTKNTVISILKQVSNFSNSSDNTFNKKFKELNELIQDELAQNSENPTFIANKFYKPFLESVKEAIAYEASSAKEKFICSIQGTNHGPKLTLDKKYPLHVVGKEIRIYIPARNTGPGIADHVNADISTTNVNVKLQAASVFIGEVAKGNFVLPVSFKIIEPTKEVNLSVIFSWKTVGKDTEEMTEILIQIKAQSTDVDWNLLETLRPYSLDIATGSNFYGRKDKVSNLASYTTSAKMQSSYITGQRRVGKSSLAKAVQDKVTHLDSNIYVLNTDVGEFKNHVALETVNSLAQNIFYFLSEHFPHGMEVQEPEMKGSLSPLSRVISALERTEPKKRFLIIIDEFDEINQEIYKSSEIAETFFLNIRSLSTKKNICFCLIGAEKMPFVMSSQGEKLNKFTRVSLDIFQHDEWQDYESIVKANLGSNITWLDSAIRHIYNITNGHPYFTNLICVKVFETIVKSKDAEISEEDVEYSVKELLPSIPVAAFQHFWKDGIFGTLKDVEIESLKRCRVLIGIARTIRLKQALNIDNITSNLRSNQLPETGVLPILMDFERRGIILENNHTYQIVIPLFEKWLVNQGFNQLIADRYGDQLAEEKKDEEDLAYINDDEINELTNSWPNYKGIQTSSHSVREWLSQEENHVNQRLLFKLLTHIKFLGESEIRIKLKELHEKARKKFAVIVTTHKAQRRKDIWITYVDGPGKSGAQFAALYAEENLISTTGVKEISEINKLIGKHNKFPDGVSSIIIVDDFIGSGESFSGGIQEFYKRNGVALNDSNVNVLAVVICATPEGEDKVRETLRKNNFDCDLVVCEHLKANHFAFKEGSSIWSDSTEMHNAKELCLRLGAKLNKKLPLGYNNQGLLVVFSRNCPNNSLPILHSQSRGDKQWNPLFKRTKH